MRIFFEEVHFPPEKRDAGIKAASDFMEYTRGEKGCVFARLLGDANDSGVFYFMEQWETEADWDAHLAASRGSEAGASIVGATDRAPNPQLFDASSVPFH